MKTNFNTLPLAVLGGWLLTHFPSLLAVSTGVLTNTDGRQFEGRMMVLADDTIRLDVSVDEGFASYLFGKDKIEKIDFFDAEQIEEGLEALSNEQYEAAIKALEPVHQQRSPFIRLYPLLTLAEPSLGLGEAYFQAGRFVEALGIASTLLGITFEDAQIHARSKELMLRSFFKLEQWEETAILAERWCKNHDPTVDSALGWWILGESQLAAGDSKNARWTSLQPITFSSQYPKPYLENCYPVVIQSWLVEKNPEKALDLYREFLDRQLTWPAEKAELHSFMEEILRERDHREETQPSETAVEIPAGQPEKDLNLPLESVRKNTAKTENSIAP